MSVKITIVTPVYNGERFISQTIESILSQQGDFFIDYIVVDDGSTDNSLTIIKEYDEKIKNGSWPILCKGISYKYFTGPNRGQSRAYNKGFGMAEGHIMSWMNADDYYLPRAFERIAEVCEKDPSIDFIYADPYRIYEDGHVVNEPKPRPDESLESLRTKGNSFEICFFTKRIFDKVGPLDESLNYCLDLDFWFKVFKVGKVMYLPHQIAAFRIWSGSKTGTQQDKFTAERKIVFKRHGGSFIPPKKIYAFRAKMQFLNFFQKKTPRLYSASKKLFYKILSVFKYSASEKSKNQAS